MQPPTNIKQYRKWKKEQYRLIEEDISDKEQLIQELSPYYEAKAGIKKGLEAVSIFSTTSVAYQVLAAEYKKGIDSKDKWASLHKNLWQHLRSMVVFDKGINEYNINDDKARLARDEEIDWVIALISDCSAEAKYYFLKKICELQLLSKVTETQLCWNCYYENNEMKSEFTYKIGTHLINRVDNDAVDAILDWEIERFKNMKDGTIRGEMGIKDALRMKEYREKGEMFYAYRGFLVEQDTYVRAGKKEDGEAYYQWKSGTGLSFTFERDTAYYFCYWQMKFMELGDKFALKKSPMDGIPDSIKTKQEWIEMMSGRISQMIDATGKKPIVGRFLIEPTTIAMANIGMNEAEVNLNPDNALLVDYQIASSKQIAEAMWDRKYAHWADSGDVIADIDGSKVIMFNAADNKLMFAEASAVKEKIDKCKQEYLKNADLPTLQSKLNEIFTENAVEIPGDINIHKRPTMRFLEFLTRNEERLVRKRGRAYVSSQS